MRKWSRYLVGVLAVAGLNALAACAEAETCTLELKKVDLQQGSDAAPAVARSVVPQSFLHSIEGSAQIVSPLVGLSGSPAGAKRPEFSQVIKKEPASYHSKSPFRGVAELGSQHYGFVLDTDPVEEPAAENPSAPKPPAKEPSAAVPPMGGIAAPMRIMIEAGGLPPYRRLHFDLNHNGDLTDDAVVEAPASRTGTAVFSPIDVRLDLDGKKVDYAFRLSVSSRRSASFSYATASLSAAVYRDGKIKLDGSERRVVLVDRNSNGRFDDPPVIDERYRSSNDSIYALAGDMFYLDPQVSRTIVLGAILPSSTSGGGSFYVGGLIRYADRFFNVKVDASGETLTIEPFSEPLGYVTNPNKGFKAFVFGDRGVLEIVADPETGKAPLPPGNWRLLSYTIDRTGLDEELTVLDVLYRALPSPPNRTAVMARGARSGKAVTVVGGQTAEMAFGAPYHLKVTGQAVPGKNSISLSMTLVGGAGESCSGMVVKGSQPSQPEFTITKADGSEVATGKFKYG